MVDLIMFLLWILVQCQNVTHLSSNIMSHIIFLGRENDLLVCDVIKALLRL